MIRLNQETQVILQHQKSELQEEATVEEYLTVQKEGSRNVKRIL